MEQEITYEQAMKRLEALARQMEGGDIAIDELSTRLKEAQELITFCRDKLTKAESEVKKLLADE